MDPIRTLFLDAGGVLVWPNWNRVADVFRGRGIEVDPQRLVEADPIARFALNEAQVVPAPDQQRSKSFFELVLLEAGVELSTETEAALTEVRAYHRTENLWEVVPPFVMPALAGLRDAGYQLVVVSNANGTVHKLFDRVGLSQYFEVIIDSELEGVEKPDRRIFEIALERSGASPNTTVHTGDLFEIDVVGARGAGLRGAVLVDESWLYDEADCPRIRTIADLAEVIKKL
jgi:putative hydrolase of the HAD superfamily